MGNELMETGGGGFAITKARMEDLRGFVSVIIKGGFAPKGCTPESGVCAIIYGLELGITNPLQAMQQIAVINGRPSIFGDAPLALVLKSGKMQGSPVEVFEGQGDELAAICTVTRVGSEPAVKRFSVAMAKKANLWGKAGPWTQYPSRMLQVRARAMALRDQFADVLSGINIGEEARDIPNGDDSSVELPASAVISGPSSAPPLEIVNADPPGFDYAAPGEGDQNDQGDQDDRELQEEEREPITHPLPQEEEREATAPSSFISQEEPGVLEDLRGEVMDLLTKLENQSIDASAYSNLPLHQLEAGDLEKIAAEMREKLTE